MENILFMLVPKKEVVFLPTNCSVQFALDVMDKNGYSAIPVINDKGKYVGTITEGDLLWAMRNNPKMTFETASRFTLTDVKRNRKVVPAGINESLSRIVELSKSQNFVPVVDDNGTFIGLITRQEVIDYLLKKDRVLQEAIV
ncbi:CBS domain-containing protein [Alkalibacter rhizosphaerae]|uniref:CBS domain-containing protein n=1 Tax=Alkalibacter rhizosphaerae TaxID=2815577 RepID=A0A975AIP9_9FIRM|nr:CBS domain-containing protein [Alkalibacter rhizosphaerae]QSX09323.1 CBS domain-containing protein [Alkalibacter rhizosphaerae]